MHSKMLRALGIAATGLWILAGVAPAHAETVKITVTNSQPGGGFAFSPVFFGLHDGTHPLFTAGDGLTGNPLQSVAELGNAGPLAAASSGFGPGVIVGSMPYLPGTSATGLLNVSDPAATRYLNFASMVVPSNDFFMGNDAANPITLFNAAGQLIDSNGNLTTSRTILVFGKQVWDAGTEVNNVNSGAAFIVGDNATDHVAENGSSTLVFGGAIDETSYLNSILGKATPGGYDISHLISQNDLIATFQFQSVPEPSSVTLAGVGLTGLALVAYRRRRRVARGA